jgi:hypothetical protein
MTQALNLALFANKLNTSGQTDNTGLQNSAINIATTSPITGGANTSLGGTVTIAHANSGVTATSYTNANITVNAQGHITAASNGSSASGTVTSVATGNGLSGGTITTTGTLVVACPAFNTVGSYCAVGDQQSVSGTNYSSGSNYSAGTGASQFVSKVLYQDACTGNFTFQRTNNLSGTWKWMSGTYNQGHLAIFGLGCRVS